MWVTEAALLPQPLSVDAEECPLADFLHKTTVPIDPTAPLVTVRTGQMLAVRDQSIAGFAVATTPGCEASWWRCDVVLDPTALTDPTVLSAQSIIRPWRQKRGETTWRCDCNAV